MRNKVQRAKKALETCGLSDTRAWDACFQVQQYQLKIAQIEALLEPLFAVTSHFVTTEENRATVEQAVNAIADKLSGGEHEIYIHPFERPVNMDAWMAPIVISGREVRLQKPGQTTDQRAFFEEVGKAVLQKTREELLQRFKEWKANITGTSHAP
jgi:hypothetical protein